MPVHDDGTHDGSVEQPQDEAPPAGAPPAEPPAGSSWLQRLADLAAATTEAVGDLLDIARGLPDAVNDSAAGPGPVVPGAAADPLTTGSPYLIPGLPGQLPGRWCAGTIELRFDLSQAASAGLDPTTERELWREAAAAWTAASAGRYRLIDGGDARVGTTRGQVAVQTISSSIAVTYGGAPGEVVPSHESAVLSGATAGYGGLTVRAVGSNPRDGRAEAGYVIIDAPDVVDSLPTEQRRLQLYIHELGHALGLAHTDGVESIMGPEVSVDEQSIGARDRSAIRALADLPCAR